VERLKERFPKIQGPAAQDICYATENRQMAVKAWCRCASCCWWWVRRTARIPSAGGSLRELGRSGLSGRRPKRSETAWLEGVQTVAVTAGASAPEHLVEELIGFLQRAGFDRARRNGNQGRGRAVLICHPNLAARCSCNDHRARMSPSLQLAEADCRNGCARAPPTTCSICRRAKATGGRADGRYHARIRLHSASSCGGIRRLNGVWNPPTRPSIDKAVRSILARQLPDGGFNIYAEGPSEISATVKAYSALKLAGWPYDDPRMARLRERILALGGMQAANSYVKINLSLFDLYPRELLRLRFLPKWCCCRQLIYEMSSWTRAIVIPLSIVHAMNPRRPVPAGFTLDELFVPGVPLEFPQRRGIFQLAQFLSGGRQMPEVVGAARLARHPPQGDPPRRAVDARADSLFRRLGAIYPPMMYVIMALDLLGIPRSSGRQRKPSQFNNLMVDDGEASSSSRVSRRCGTRRSRRTRWANRAWSRTSCAAPPTGC
jgi:hypothetical protein